MDLSSHENNENRNGEQGNVLFLIIIAVVLFGYLAYAVTQTIRGGGTDIGRETDMMANSSLIQYSVNVRTAILRKVVAGQVFSTLEFNTPAEYANCTAGFKRCVFHPHGLGATYALPPSDVMANGVPTDWIYNGENEIALMGASTGTNASSPNTADLIAFMPGISQRFCKSINDSISVPLIPVESDIVFTSASNMVNSNGSTNTSMDGTGATIGDPTGVDVSYLNAQIYGCFEQDGQYVYYHTMVEQ